MSLSAPFVQLSFLLPSIAGLVRASLVLSLFAGLLIFFRPLLTGVTRALVLALRSCLSRKERAGAPEVRL